MSFAKIEIELLTADAGCSTTATSPYYIRELSRKKERENPLYCALYCCCCCRSVARPYLDSSEATAAAILERVALLRGSSRDWWVLLLLVAAIGQQVGYSGTPAAAIQQQKQQPLRDCHCFRAPFARVVYWFFYFASPRRLSLILSPSLSLYSSMYYIYDTMGSISHTRLGGALCAAYPYHIKRTIRNILGGEFFRDDCLGSSTTAVKAFDHPRE